MKEDTGISKSPSTKNNVRTIYKVLSVIGIVATAAVCIWAWKSGLLESVGAMRETVHAVGFWGPILFVIIQIAQVVIPIIPGGISLLAGVVIFGPIWGFIYNYVGIVMGSMIAFLIVRKLGKPFLQNVSSKKTYDKYIGWLNKGKRFERFFAIAILMPVAPDDFLCMLAGLTKMSFKKLTAILVICKPPTIIVYSLGLSFMAGWVTKLFLA